MTTLIVNVLLGFLAGMVAPILLRWLLRPVKRRIRTYVLDADRPSPKERDPYFNREYARPAKRRRSLPRAA